jgi:hypothetical protein
MSSKIMGLLKIKTLKKPSQQPFRAHKQPFLVDSSPSNEPYRKFPKFLLFILEIIGRATLSKGN